jgi:hypothetical protein
MANDYLNSIKTIYTLLEKQLRTTLSKELQSERLDKKSYPMILSQCLTTVLQLSVGYPLTQAQADLAKAQEKETLDLIEAKKENLTKQNATEDAKTALYEKQAQAYVDNLRIQRADKYMSTVATIYAGGTAVDAQIWRTGLIMCKQIVDADYNGSDLPDLT